MNDTSARPGPIGRHHAGGGTHPHAGRRRRLRQPPEPSLPSVRDKLRESHIDGQPKIKIGVATTEPLMGELRNGAHVGFDVEIARYVAASLGYEGDQRIECVSVATEDRIPSLQGGLSTWWCPASP